MGREQLRISLSVADSRSGWRGKLSPNHPRASLRVDTEKGKDESSSSTDISSVPMRSEAGAEESNRRIRQPEIVSEDRSRRRKLSAIFEFHSLLIYQIAGLGTCC